MSDYDDLAAALLAQIADLLLGQKKDWATLERLSAALLAPTGTERKSEIVAPVMDQVTKAYVDMEIRDQLKPEPQFGRLSYEPITTTTNVSSWIQHNRKT